MRCKTCGYIKKNLKEGRCYLCSKKKSKKKGWEDCICHHQNHHTPECKRNHRKNLHKEKYYPKRTEERHELRKQHRCIWCKKKVKPKITYPQLCEEHNEKNRKLKKEQNE